MKRKELNLPEPQNLENLLASWKPRSPSARLRGRLFGRQSVHDTGTDDEGFLLPLWRLLAPAFAGVFVMLLAVAPRADRMSAERAKSDSLLVAVARNQINAAYLTASSHSEQNGPARETLEWTFNTRSISTMSPLPGFITNTLKH